MPRLRTLVLVVSALAIFGSVPPRSVAEEEPEATVVVRCAVDEVQKVRAALDALGLDLAVEVFVPEPAPVPTEGSEEELVPLSDATATMRDVLRTVNAVSPGPGDGAYVVSIDVRPARVRMRVRFTDVEVLKLLGKAFTDREGFEGIPTLEYGPAEDEGAWVADMLLERAPPTGPVKPSAEQASGVDYDALVLLGEEEEMRLLRAGRLHLEREGETVIVRQRLAFESGSVRTLDRLLTRIAIQTKLVVERITWTLEAPLESATRIRMSEIEVARRFAERALEARRVPEAPEAPEAPVRD